METSYCRFQGDGGAAGASSAVRAVAESPMPGGRGAQDRHAFITAGRKNLTRGFARRTHDDAARYTHCAFLRFRDPTGRAYQHHIGVPTAKPNSSSPASLRPVAAPPLAVPPTKTPSGVAR